MTANAMREWQWFARNKPDRSDAARVDYALVSKSLIHGKRIRKMEYLEDPKWRYRSDHCPFRIDVDVDVNLTWDE